MIEVNWSKRKGRKGGGGDKTGGSHIPRKKKTARHGYMRREGKEGEEKDNKPSMPPSVQRGEEREEKTREISPPIHWGDIDIKQGKKGENARFLAGGKGKDKKRKKTCRQAFKRTPHHGSVGGRKRGGGEKRWLQSRKPIHPFIQEEKKEKKRGKKRGPPFSKGTMHFRHRK